MHIDAVAVLSMFMLSFILVIVCGFFEWKRICAGFYGLFIYVLPLDIQPSRDRIGGVMVLKRARL